jgi:hypothetical protein
MNTPTSIQARLGAALALVLAFAPLARADAGVADPPTLATVPVSNPGVEERMREELHGMLRRLADAGAFEEARPQDFALSLSLPAQRSVDLGLVLDTRADPARGLAVLATAPGGTAQQLGLVAGDVIAAVDGRSLAGDGAAAAATLRAAAAGARDGDQLRLAVLRDGRSLELQGPVHAQYLPALRLELGEGTLVASNAPVALAPAVASAAPAQAATDTCGRISTFHIAPRQQRLYRARVLSIDGKLPGTARQETYRVAPGRHVLEISEDIDTQDLPDYFSRLRPRFGRQVLEVEVEAGMTALVAAQLLDDVPAKGRPYWEPKVWKTIAEPCH